MRPRKYFISDSLAPPPRFLLKCKQRNKEGGKGEGDDRKKKEETGRPANRMSLLPLLVFHPVPCPALMEGLWGGASGWRVANSGDLRGAGAALPTYS